MTIRSLTFLQDNTKGKPIEDSFSLAGPDANGLMVAAVSDGVTRYVSEGKDYPNPSYASVVARLFCSKAVASISERFSDEPSLLSLIILSFAEGNKNIADLNRELGITAETVDYLENDYFGCQAVVGLVADRSESKLADAKQEDRAYLRGGFTLTYGYISDCGLMVFDKDFFPIFFSNDRAAAPLAFGTSWGFKTRKERRVFVGKELRNNPHTRRLTYGSLTGEEEALRYLQTGSIFLNSGDTIVFFSDGILPFILEREFREKIQLELQNRDSTRAQAAIEDLVELLIPSLEKRHISNLDDDKAFVAISL